jgi:hypothetical protein
MREVKSASGACECLVDWPHAKRGGSAYRDAVEACNAVASGNGTVDLLRAKIQAEVDKKYNPVNLEYERRLQESAHLLRRKH